MLKGKLKLKREVNGQTEEVATIEIVGDQAIVWVGGRKFKLDIDDGKQNFISLTILEVNQL